MKWWFLLHFFKGSGIDLSEPQFTYMHGSHITTCPSISWVTIESNILTQVLLNQTFLLYAPCWALSVHKCVRPMSPCTIYIRNTKQRHEWRVSEISPNFNRCNASSNRHLIKHRNGSFNLQTHIYTEKNRLMPEVYSGLSVKNLTCIREIPGAF